MRDNTFDLSAAISTQATRPDGTLTLAYSHMLGGKNFDAGVRISSTVIPLITPEPETERFVAATLTWALRIPAGDKRVLTVTAESTYHAATIRIPKEDAAGKTPA